MKKIDFAIVISACNCNPNGDPVNLKMPRQNREGFGQISDVCLKHKIRRQLSLSGDDCLLIGGEGESVKDRVMSASVLDDARSKKNDILFKETACAKWIDVRAFGQVFAFKAKDGNVSIGIRGPVSLGIAETIEEVNITEFCITKSMNNETDPNDPLKKDSTTIGTRYAIDRGVYVAYGSILPQLASLTGFDESDAVKVKNAIASMFESDASVMRPSGSMSCQLFWWTHNKKIYNSAVVHHLLRISPAKEWPYYTYTVDELPNLDLEII